MLDLRQRRSELRLSQSQLARLSGVSRFKICLHELGDRRLTDEEVASVQDALRLEVSRLAALSDRAIGQEVMLA
jgi:predicted transcriptional regulator